MTTEVKVAFVREKVLWTVTSGFRSDFYGKTFTATLQFNGKRTIGGGNKNAFNNIIRYLKQQKYFD
jgi:hypothetical protein